MGRKPNQKKSFWNSEPVAGSESPAPKEQNVEAKQEKQKQREEKSAQDISEHKKFSKFKKGGE